MCGKDANVWKEQHDQHRKKIKTLIKIIIDNNKERRGIHFSEMK